MGNVNGGSPMNAISWITPACWHQASATKDSGLGQREKPGNDNTFLINARSNFSGSSKGGLWADSSNQMRCLRGALNRFELLLGQCRRSVHAIPPEQKKIGIGAWDDR